MCEEMTLAEAADQLGLPIPEAITALGITRDEIATFLAKYLAKYEVHQIKGSDPWLFEFAQPLRNYQEVADIMGMHRQTVRDVELRALEKLREIAGTDRFLQAYAADLEMETGYMTADAMQRKIEALSLITDAILDDIVITEGSIERRIRPSDVKLFLLFVLARCDEHFEFTTRKRDFARSTGMGERALIRMTIACEKAGFITVASEGQQTTYTLLTQAIKRRSEFLKADSQQAS